MSSLFPELDSISQEHHKYGRSRESKINDYQGFVDKFKPKLTTDDCYTPPPVYDAVCRWVDRNICPLEGRLILRPFKPGGDYQEEYYPPGCIVLDNPPFSILAQIVKWYQARGIDFFLFAPSLTLFGPCRLDGITAIVAHAEVTYENGAVVRTSFITNMEKKHKVIVAGDLYKEVTQASDANVRTQKQHRCVKGKFYPMEMISSANLGRLVVRGICMKVPMEEALFVRKLDNQKESSIFGGGFLISERAAAERAAAERAAAERAAAERIELSAREIEICKKLGKNR